MGGRSLRLEAQAGERVEEERYVQAASTRTPYNLAIDVQYAPAGSKAVVSGEQTEDSGGGGDADDLDSDASMAA